MTSQGSIKRDGFELRFCIEGEGPNALVIGSSLYSARSFSKDLRTHLRLHFVDYRGFAKQIPSAIEKIPSFEEILEDIECLRKKLSLTKCILIGHSAHALLAIEYAKKYPEHISHVVMIGISPSFSPEYAAMAERNWEESVWPERKQALRERIEEFSDEKLANLPAAERFVKWNIRRAAQIWFDFHFDSSPLWKDVSLNMPILDFVYGKALRDLDITKGLKNFDKPVLLALGRFDYILAPSSSWDPIRPFFKNLTVRLFERSGHSPHYEEPTIFDRELLSWLQKN